MATPKTKLTKKMKCIQVNKSVGRTTINFAADITEDEKGGRARNIFTYNSSDTKDAEGFEPEKEYTITITE